MRILILVAAIFLWAYAATGADDGNSTSLEICDSSSCNSIIDNSFPEISLNEVDSVARETIGDPQMDLLAENIDNNALPNVDVAKDCNMDLSTSNSVIETVHIDWLSGGSTTDNLTVIVSLDKFIQAWGNSTQGVINLDKLPPA